MQLSMNSVWAKPEVFQVDPTHTFPSFEADHMGGMSLWRGKINKTSGTIEIDEDAQQGSVNIVMDMTSIDFGLDDMNDHAKSDDMFDVEKFPTARYSGAIKFVDGSPSQVLGDLTLHGVTKPVVLQIESFKCMFHPMKLKRACGANAVASINRDDFGVDYAKLFGFDMKVDLRVSVEALKSK
jgi:polyisoprenoid-binding protein YceI